MNKNLTISVIITSIAGLIIVISLMGNKILSQADKFYQVYLNGNIIGILNGEKVNGEDDKDRLFGLIDKNQSAIKNEYHVNNVYPPTDLLIVESNSYIAKTTSVEDIYNEISKEDNFTIKGYVVTIKLEDKDYTLNVLNKDIFYEAAKRFVRAFLDENEYEKYINNTQSEIVDTGRIIEGMRFLEDIKIREAYISVDEKIYTSDLDLVQFLLFGDKPSTKSYTIKLGDTIESVAENNKLSVEEFLIANTNYKTKDIALRVGDKVNVTLIDPQLTFVYDLNEIKDETVYFEKNIVYDNTKYTSYREVTTKGINGKNRYQEFYSVTNGVRSQNANVTQIATIKEVQNQVTTIGTKVNYSNIYIPQNPVVLDGSWAWPTNRGYLITSNYGWRWGAFHRGIDISGAGNFNSPIYASGDGVVTTAFNGCPSWGNGLGDRCGGEMGNMIVITHTNGYVTRYAHLHQNFLVRAGQTVKKGDQIGYMGNSGSSTGPHLHYEVIVNGGNRNPLELYR